MKKLSFVLITSIFSLCQSNLCVHSPLPDPISIPDLVPTVTWEPFNGNLFNISFSHPTIVSIAGSCNYAILLNFRVLSEYYGSPNDYDNEIKSAFTYSSPGGVGTCTYQRNLNIRNFGTKNNFYYNIVKLERIFLRRRMVKRNIQ